jgi:hypothetical protein
VLRVVGRVVEAVEGLVEHLDRWGVYPEVTCADRLPLSDAAT